MNWNQEFKTYKTLRYLGLFLLAFAIILWTVSIIEIVRSEIMLSNAQPFGLSMEQIWGYEGALLWWTSIYGSVIVPVIIILVAGGIVSMMHTQFLSVVQGIVLRLNLFDLVEQKEFSKDENL